MRFEARSSLSLAIQPFRSMSLDTGQETNRDPSSMYRTLDQLVTCRILLEMYPCNLKISLEDTAKNWADSDKYMKFKHPAYLRLHVNL